MLASSAFFPGERTTISTDGGHIASPGKGNEDDGGTIPTGGNPGGNPNTNLPGGTPPTTGNSPPGGGAPLPTPDTDGGIIGDGGDRDDDDGGVITDVEIARICTWHGVPMFFEDASHPILTLEVMLGPAAQMQQLATFSFTTDWTRPEPFTLSALSLRGVDLILTGFSTRIGIPTGRLGNDQIISARICNDPENDRSCANNAWNQIISPASLDFFVGHTPTRLTVDAFSGRVGYNPAFYWDLPEFCERLRSPLVLDLNGNGTRLSSTSNGVYFDINAEGAPIATAWTLGSDDAFLVRDLDGNGRIESGRELFGSATLLPDGSAAQNGFEALRALDSDGDGRFSPSDDAWSRVSLWADRNRNGLSERSELRSLASVGMESIALDYVETREVDLHGNETRQRSTFQRDGIAGLIIDVWFNTLARH